MCIKITNGRLLLPCGICEGLKLYCSGGKITAITAEDLPCDRELDARGCYVAPGFIDIHVHGGDGYEFIDATETAVLSAANIHGRHGTTTIFPTLSAFDEDTTVNALAAIDGCLGSDALLPNIGGVHLEGPYFSKNQCGAQDPRFIRPPERAEYQRLADKFPGLIKRWSYAPEAEGAEDFQRFLAQRGIVGAAGHTDAEYCHVKAAFDLGCKLITHLYSATSTVTRKGGFRHLGVIESAWLLDDMDVETIADGCHLPPLLLQLIYKLKGPEHMCLITDAIRYGGSTGCENTVSGTEAIPYIIEDGVAKLADRSAFAGSIATADALIRTCVKKADIPLTDAVAMLTRIPARIMGLTQKGQLEEGLDADIVIFDEDIQIQSVLVGGIVKG